MLEQLDVLIEAALKSMIADLRASAWCCRERELVSLFVLGYLIRLCAPNGVLHDPTQIGIEVAVPQLAGRGGQRTKPDVCKDVVIWAQPSMTCWGRNGDERLYPLSVLEWKSLNRHDRGAVLTQKRREHATDLHWLAETSRIASPFVGYAVLVDQQLSPVCFAVARACRGEVTEGWLVA
jgi:hypothetical protein